jgi:hypothetical protein
LTSVTIPDSVTSILSSTFSGCTSLTNVTIPDNVTTIGDWAFSSCINLTDILIPNSVTTIGGWGFYGCTSLTNVTIGDGLASIGWSAFEGCTNLTEVYFAGNAPNLESSVFLNDNGAVVYYLPGTSGWETMFGDRPTALWLLPNPLILQDNSSFGLRTNRFGFIISWATNTSVVVEASTDLANSNWSRLATNTLTGGWSYFSDPQWTNHQARFYRIRSP